MMKFLSIFATIALLTANGALAADELKLIVRAPNGNVAVIAHPTECYSKGSLLKVCTASVEPIVLGSQTVKGEVIFIAKTEYSSKQYVVCAYRNAVPTCKKSGGVVTYK